MIPEIEVLKKLSAGSINKAKLPAIIAAQEAASCLAASLEAKSDSEEDTSEFEGFESDLEIALDDLQSGCDELEMAEEKEEREDAIDQIERALNDVISYLEAIMKIAVISEVDHTAIHADATAKIQAIIAAMAGQFSSERFNTELEAWYASSTSEPIKRSRKKAVASIFEEIAQAAAAEEKK